MTIGWGTIGIIWKRPVFTVLVRHSRFTHELIEESGEFSVNVLDAGYSKQILYCGSHSGRDVNKLSDCHFDIEPGSTIAVPHLSQASIVYECRVVHTNEVDPDTLDRKIYEHYYTREALHTVYNGEILAVFRER
jgi:flavin reductase (DIM6/NTAB) family NADH-FMN oxidoreductase RutF